MLYSIISKSYCYPIFDLLANADEEEDEDLEIPDKEGDDYENNDDDDDDDEDDDDFIKPNTCLVLKGIVIREPPS